MSLDYKSIKTDNMKKYKYIHQPSILIGNELKEVNILIENDRIIKISEEEIPNLPSQTQIIEAKGLTLLPGIIDIHVHFRQPGLEHKADMLSESRAAVAGGVTTVFDMPNTLPPTTNLKALTEKINLAKENMLCNYKFYLGITNNNLQEALSIDPSLICGYKIYLGSSTGDMLVDKAQAIEGLFEKSNLIITAHCEDEKRIRENTKKYKEIYPDNDAPATIHPLVRDSEACYLSTKFAIGLTNQNTRLNIAHITSEKELSLLKSGKIDSKNITAEVSPVHLWFEEKDFERLGNKIKCNPSIKAKSDRDALRKALREDKIDFVATDHAPHLMEEKEKPYFQAPSGIPSIQFSLNIMLELVRQGELKLSQVQEKMCHNPATYFHLEDRGYIKEGYYADLVLVDLNGKTKVTNDIVLSKCKWSAFEGETFNSKIVATFVNGEEVYSQK